MEGEINNFIMVWTLAILSVCYCYRVAQIVPKGTTRFLAILPVVCLFLFLPLNLNSIHLGLTTAFYIAWLANFKLLLFSFGLGPLSGPTIPLAHFIFYACLPIKAQENTHYNKDTNLENEENPTLHTSSRVRKYTWIYRKQALFLAFLVFLDANKKHIPKKIMQVIYCVYTYIGLECVLGLAGRLARNWLGLELEPPFNDPYLSTSLQDFWGRRWNKMGSDILRSAIYNPVLYYSKRALGYKLAHIPAVLCTFLVSGLMHELLMFYVGRVRPSWAFTRFFLIQGLCLTIEGALKRKITGTQQRLPRVITGPVIFGFVILMFIWLVRPQLEALKTDARGVEEYAAVGRFVMDLGRAIKKRLVANS